MQRLVKREKKQRKRSDGQVSVLAGSLCKLGPQAWIKTSGNHIIKLKNYQYVNRTMIKGLLVCKSDNDQRSTQIIINM